MSIRARYLENIVGGFLIAGILAFGILLLVGGASVALAGTAKSVSLHRLDAGLFELERTMRAIQGLPLIRKQVEKGDAP